MNTFLCLWLALTSFSILSAGELKLASLFTDHAVLQRDAKVPVWGWAEAGAKIKVEFAGQNHSTTADSTGKWELKLSAMPASAEPRILKVSDVSGQSSTSLHDILVGDVWLCTGQSNMVVPLKSALNGDAEIAQATHPLLRFYQVARVAKETPQTECSGDWIACTPASAESFCAVGYFFGREIQTTVGVPIGLIQSSWGATAAEAWVSEAALRSSDEFKALIGKRTEPKKDKEQNAGGEGDKGVPSTLYNGMIAPLAPYALRGSIWYQGENNANDAVRAEAYRRLLPLMVTGWRNDFGQTFPFYIVQLAGFSRRGDAPATDPWRVSLWSVLRESQAVAASTLTKSGLAVAIDIGEADQIHPKNKQDVGRRLALIALAKDYGKSVEFSGPVFKTMTVKNNAVVVAFNHADGLAAKGGTLKGFLLAGEDGRFQVAQGTIEGNTVRVSSPAVPQPIAVRYAWSNFTDATLINGAGLPAGPFRFPEK